jgi:hypothetical protein
MYKNVIHISATSLPRLQSARDYVQGYVYERGFKVRFETTWVNKQWHPYGRGWGMKTAS